MTKRRLNAQGAAEVLGVSVDAVRMRGAYTITPAGFEWLKEGPPTLSEQPEMAPDKPEKAGLRPGGEEARGETERPWWRRLFGG